MRLFTITIDDDDRDEPGNDTPFVATIVRVDTDEMLNDTGMGTTPLEAVLDLLDGLRQSDELQTELDLIAEARAKASIKEAAVATTPPTPREEVLATVTTELDYTDQSCKDDPAYPGDTAQYAADIVRVLTRTYLGGE